MVTRQLGWSAVPLTIGALVSLMVVPGRCRGQGAPLQPRSTMPTASDFVSYVCSGPGSTDHLTCDDAQTKSSNSTHSDASADGHWKITLAPYLWFPGMHGTVG